MDEKLGILLSTYLDGEVTSAERAQVEQLLSSDPEARIELEQLRAWHAQIQSAVPPAIPVPPDFRKSILDKLKAAQTTPTSGPATGNFLAGSSGWWLAGLTCVGLISGLVYFDLNNQKQIQQAEQAGRMVKSEDLAVGRLKLAKPEYRGSRERQVEAAVNAGAGRGSAAESLISDNAAAGGGVVDQDIYRFGQGQALQKHSGAPVAEVREEVGPRPVNRLGWESTRPWTLPRLAALAVRYRGTNPQYTAKTMLDCARTYRINPLLLVAVAQDQSQLEPKRLALRIQTVLATTNGQSEEQQLLAVAQSLGGNATWLARWKKVLESIPSP